MANVIVILLLLLAVLWACNSIRKSRKNGTGCMGCPHADACSDHKCSKKPDPKT